MSSLTKMLKNYFAGSYPIRILLGALFAAVVADGIITMFLVDNGFAYEGNPFLSYWVCEDKLLSLKISGGLLATICLWSLYKRHAKLSLFFSSVFLTAYTFIVFWNLHILL